MSSMQEMDFSAVVSFTPAELTPVNTPTVLNMEYPRSMLEPFRDKARALFAEATGIKVHDQASQLAATTLAGRIKKIAKTVEDARKEYTSPINDHIKSVNGLSKEISAPLESGLRHLTGQLNQYASRVELERRKAEEEARRKAEEEQERLNAEAKAAGVEAPIVPEVLPVLSEHGTVRTESGTAYQRKTWTFDVDNLDDVPRAYLVLSESAVRSAIKNGIRSIPGLRIYETSSTVIR